MKFFNVVLLTTSAAAAARRHRTGQNNGSQNANDRNRGGNTVGAGGTTGDNGSAKDTTTGATLVLKEVGGVLGNECLTFRNNGEIVDAACVNEAADRQITPATINGELALHVQRDFSAGFRADLVGVQAIELVSFTDGGLRTPSGACASGHDGLA
ncbi:hypothetical protein EKO27_g2192 [Xylaria grammica]|uniref:Cyanovirin-N domain-containing protein n=1 Tax=Xylaria grammica TaxID=363999 RepID=A0A439DEU7_9PEZI|nr:hypothetical protein EKO27_g2192 [Xylaria grammica]